MKQGYKIVLLAALLGLSACADHTAGVAVNSAGETRVDNSSFAKQVSVEQIDSHLVGDLTQATALIVSKASSDIRVQYKFTWFDASGFTIEDEASSWKSLKLHGMQQMQVNAVAPNAMAIRFEVYVREAFSN